MRGTIREICCAEYNLCKAGMTSLEKIFPFLQILFVAVAAGQDGDRDGDNSGRDGVVTTICQP